MKIPTEFAPKSWEMPPGFVVLEESASVVAREFDGEKLDWLVALVETPPLKQPFLWMRPLDSRFDAGFSIAATNGWDLGWQKVGLKKDAKPSSLCSILNATWNDNQMARRIMLNKHCELRNGGEDIHEYLIVGSDGLAAWFVKTKIQWYGTSAPTPFHWNEKLTNIEFLHLPALEVWGKLRKMLADPQSEAAFAHRFARMNHKRRESQVFEKRRGTDQNAEALLRTRVQMDNIWNEIPKDSNLPLKLDIYWGKCYWTIPGQKLSEPPQELVGDFHRILRWFRPIKVGIINLRCVWQWVRSVERFEFEMFPPTAHEQLEAQLRWREWKAKHEKL